LPDQAATAQKKPSAILHPGRVVPVDFQVAASLDLQLIEGVGRGERI
jgi:hypothetical protein